MSVDGFYAARDGNPLVLNMDAAFDAYNRVRIEAADLLLLGRKSYEGFSSVFTQPAAFTLLDSVKFGSSSNVLLRYQLNATADGGRSA